MCVCRDSKVYRGVVTDMTFSKNIRCCVHTVVTKKNASLHSYNVSIHQLYENMSLDELLTQKEKRMRDMRNLFTVWVTITV